MSKPASHIPACFSAVTPYLLVKDGAAALTFYRQLFGAVEVSRMADPDGRVRHAQFNVGGAPLMLGEHPQVASGAPDTFPALSVYLYVEDADAVVAKAVELGARLIVPVGDRFYGNREGGIEDPHGIVWWVATHVEDVTPDEMARRTAAHFGSA